jgi:CRP-like cAMP-binding protein
MGSGSSVQLSPRGEHIIQDGHAMEITGSRKNFRNEKRIFERQPSNFNVDITALLDGDVVDENSRKLIVNALSGFFFLQSNENDENPKMDLLIRGMKREEVAEGVALITEGESGSKLYVVERGELEVTINGSVIREMGSGALLGELALLYDAPRSATVTTKTACVLWTLSREIFKRIQTISATANQIQRARWLIASPELAILSALDLSRLVGTLQMIQVPEGETVFVEGEVTNQIVLIEKGSGSVTSSDATLKGAGVKIVDKTLNILRPREGKRKSVDMMNAAQLNRFMSRDEGDHGSPHDTDPEEPAAAPPAPPSAESLCEVYEGCIIGTGSLRGKAQLSNCWNWTKDPKSKAEGGMCPLTLTAIGGTMSILVFTVEVFENLFGPVEKVLHAHDSSRKNLRAVEDDTKPKAKEIIFDSARFKQKFILGSGSFGVVTLAEYRADKNGPPMLCALKSLSKFAVIETGQLRHVLDERRILAFMDSPFILKLYGTYQTPHQLVMVTEPLNCGDLWSVIYETPPYCDNCGLPYDLAVFYTACLVHGLSHIHEKGVVFRDLKPENIMLDEKGYLRIIDFGFSKKVPYTKTDAHGEVKVYAKTYTLCGTPGEYLDF